MIILGVDPGTQITGYAFLQEQKQADVKDFVFKLLNLSEFDTANKDIAKSKVAETKKEIESLDILIQEYEKVQEPAKVEDLTESFNAKIADLRKKINIPTLSDADVLHNAKIEKHWQSTAAYGSLLKAPQQIKGIPLSFCKCKQVCLHLQKKY